MISNSKNRTDRKHRKAKTLFPKNYGENADSDKRIEQNTDHSFSYSSVNIHGLFTFYMHHV